VLLVRITECSSKIGAGVLTAAGFPAARHRLAPTELRPNFLKAQSTREFRNR
jgi:hypothetical protein